MLILDSSVINNGFSAVTSFDCSSLQSNELKFETPKPVTLTDLILFDKNKPNTLEEYSYAEKHFIWDFTPNEQKSIVQFTTVMAKHSFLVFFTHECFLFWNHTVPDLIRTKKKTTAERFYKLGFNSKAYTSFGRCLELHQFLADHFSNTNNTHL